MKSKVGIAPEAYTDVVAILHVAPRSAMPLSVAELHLFAYLGRIVSLFNGLPTAEWGYNFVVTSEGFPFSAELDDARQVATKRGMIIEDNEGEILPCSTDLAAEYDLLVKISDLERRSGWLRAATECSLSIPAGSIRAALNHSPGVMTASALGQRRMLLQPMDVETLYAQYAVVRNALPGLEHGMLAPAVVWLSAYMIGKEDEACAV